MVKDLGGKKVLVTGGGGFIGSHLTRRLVDLGAEVAVLTKYESIVDNVRLAALWDDICRSKAISETGTPFVAWSISRQ